jgi:hypothetical protein
MHFTTTVFKNLIRTSQKTHPPANSVCLHNGCLFWESCETYNYTVRLEVLTAVSVKNTVLDCSAVCFGERAVCRLHGVTAQKWYPSEMHCVGKHAECMFNVMEVAAYIYHCTLNG